MINTKKRAFGFGALIQTIRDRYNPIKEYKYFKKEGFRNPAWTTICCLVGHLNSNLEWANNKVFWCLGFVQYGTKFFQCGYHIGFNPDAFLQISWFKEIWVFDKTGFTIDDSIVHRWPKEERQRVTENRSLYLYSPWIIDTYYKYSAPDKRVVVEDQYGDEIIETHNFTGGVKRRKLPWWNSYRVRDRWSDDMTEFDRQCDEHITRGY